MMLKPFWLISLTHMFLETYFLVQVALIPVFIREFNLNLFEASFVATFPSVLQLLMNFPSGYLADRFNTRYLLAASMMIEGLSALLVSQINNFWFLVLGVSMLRITSPLYHICGLSQISRFAQREKMNRSMGIHNAMGSLGGGMGLIGLALLLSSSLGWRWIYILGAIPILVWGFIILKSPQIESRAIGTHEIDQPRKFEFNRVLLLFTAEFTLFLMVVGLRSAESAGTSTFMTTYLVETRNISEGTSSLVFGLGSFVGMAGSLNGGYMGEKIGAKKALGLSMLASAVSLLVLSLLMEPYLITLLYLVYAFFGNSIWSPMTAIVADVTSANQRGMGYSFYFVIEGIMISITPSLAAAVIGLSGLWYIFPLSISFLVAGVIVLGLVSRVKKHLTNE